MKRIIISIPIKNKPSQSNAIFLFGGNWNMASVLMSSGFENVECKVDGEISFLGITLKGSYYQKGMSYSFPWASYRCESSEGNCCTKQGLYSGENKLA